MIDWREHLLSDPQVCHGQLCAKGTRVLVTNILDSLAERASKAGILASFPSLRPEHIEAAIAYAAELERAMEQMAAYPAVHSECRAIDEAFRVAEGDGLEAGR